MRRDRNDLIETFKIINSNYNINSKFFASDEGDRRGHSKKLFKKRSRLDVRKFVLSNMIDNKWNSLTDTCVWSGLINFKCHISRELKAET